MNYFSFFSHVLLIWSKQSSESILGEQVLLGLELSALKLRNSRGFGSLHGLSGINSGQIGWHSQSSLLGWTGLLLGTQGSAGSGTASDVECGAAVADGVVGGALGVLLVSGAWLLNMLSDLESHTCEMLATS